ncbi:MAG: radical SAM protein [Candidatus Lokiarchaeota archaeon]|nr:radical SAM protein [Candidatus Lokiarchaeota archaeon]
MMPREYTYGPFQSRRLKLSLGIDILPKCKKCTYDCIYCEIGATGKNELVSPDFRIHAPPSHHFRKELTDILKYVPHLNSITFGYNGEPTLNENILDFLTIARQVRERIAWTNEKPRLTLFTNSSTLYFKEIRDRICEFELVLAKLDAATQEDFIKTNRPHRETPSIDEIIDSLVLLKRAMPKTNKLAIQCLVYNSYKKNIISNNNDQNIEALSEAIKKIKPDIVQIYSIARIPAQYYVFAIDDERKDEIVKKIREKVNDNSIKIDRY